MSWQGLAWASKWRANSAAEKLILLAYAECHNEETGVAYPSIAWLCEFSSLNRKTVIAAVARLESAGALEDSGERRGRTKQLKVYTVHVGKESQNRNSTEIGTVPKPDGKESQKRDTEPAREPIPQKATPSSGKRAKAGTQVPMNFVPEPAPDSITAKAMDAWPPGELDEQVEHFIDCHTAKGTISKDWQASWRTWVKNWKKFNGYQPRRQMDGKPDLRGSRPDPSLDLLYAARAAEAEERAASGGQDNWGAWSTLPAIGTS